MSAEVEKYYDDFFRETGYALQKEGEYSSIVNIQRKMHIKAMASYAREYHQKEMERKLDRALSWAEGNYPTRAGKLCYNAARIEACGHLLNHLKEDKG